MRPEMLQTCCCMCRSLNCDVQHDNIPKMLTFDLSPTCVGYCVEIWAPVCILGKSDSYQFSLMYIPSKKKNVSIPFFPCSFYVTMAYRLFT